MQVSARWFHQSNADCASIRSCLLMDTPGSRCAISRRSARSPRRTASPVRPRSSATRNRPSRSRSRRSNAQSASSSSSVPAGPDPVSLSAAGCVLDRHAISVLARLAEARADLESLVSGSSGTVRVGHLPVDRRPHPAGRPAPASASACPAYASSSSSASDEDELLALATRGRARPDVRHRWRRPRPLGLRTSRAADDRYVVLAPPGSRFDGRDDVASTELEGEELITNGDRTSCMRNVCAAWRQRRLRAVDRLHDRRQPDPAAARRHGTRARDRPRARGRARGRTMLAPSSASSHRARSRRAASASSGRPAAPARPPRARSSTSPRRSAPAILRSPAPPSIRACHATTTRSSSVERDASDADVKRAFRRLARTLHPDVSEEADAEERFKEVAEAYEVLSDPDSRSRYDRFGHDGMAGREFHTDQFMDLGNLGDLLGSLFGRDPFAARGPASGADAQTDAEITLTEAAFGAKLELDLDLVSVCDRCEGSGAEPGTAISTCPTCGGAGEVSQVVRLGLRSDDADRAVRHVPRPRTGRRAARATTVAGAGGGPCARTSRSRCPSVSTTARLSGSRARDTPASRAARRATSTSGCTSRMTRDSCRDGNDLITLGRADARTGGARHHRLGGDARRRGVARVLARNPARRGALAARQGHAVAARWRARLAARARERARPEAPDARAEGA